jgi:hypothetical protein
VTTPSDLLAAELARDGARPFITAYDAASARVELSVATTANWVAKTAGYLVDEVGLEPGDIVAVEPTLHWLHAVVLLAGWAVGARVDLSPTPDLQPLEVPLDLMGAAFLRLVSPYPERYVPTESSGAEELATTPELPRGCRLLSTLPLDQGGARIGLLAPLAVGGSVVYAMTHAHLADVAAAERVTHTAGVDVAGLPRVR